MGDSKSLFSRAGRSNTQRFGQVQKLDSWLTGRASVSPSPHFTSKSHKSIQEELLTFTTSSASPPGESQAATTAFLSQSRDQYYKSKHPKAAGPPPGTYWISYSQIDKHKGWAHVRSSKVSKLFSPPLSPSPASIGLLHPKKKPVPTVNFEKQLARGKQWLGQTSPHEARFSQDYSIPESSSKFRKSPRIRFALQIPRSRKLFPGPRAAPDHYRPQLSQTLPKSPSCVFAKAKPLRLKAVDGRQYQVSFDPVSPRVRTVMDWSLTREHQSELSRKLPRYMTGATSRMSMETLTETTLRLSGSPLFE